MKGEVVECPECDKKHENDLDLACHACFESAVEVGVHRPVLCLQCTKALNMIRSELNPCPNCGRVRNGANQKDVYRCANSNCRVKHYEQKRDVEVYEEVLKKRIESDELENPPEDAPIDFKRTNEEADNQ